MLEILWVKLQSEFTDSSRLTTPKIDKIKEFDFSTFEPQKQQNFSQNECHVIALVASFRNRQKHLTLAYDASFLQFVKHSKKNFMGLKKKFH